MLVPCLLNTSKDFFMTDLETFKQVKDLYLKQSKPEKGWWYKDTERDCLCIEGCVLNVLEFSEEQIIEAACSFPHSFNSIDEILLRQPVYRKLINVAIEVTGEKYTYLYGYNDKKKDIVAILDKAIENETISNY
jgi:hypothetical protein